MNCNYLIAKISLILIFQFLVKGVLWGQNNQFLYSMVDTTSVLTKYGYSDNHKMVVPYDKYLFNYTDTIKTIGFVLKRKEGIVAINAKGIELFKVFTFDNGPDYVSEGLFRIVGKYQKMGFANMKGQVIIKPAYDAAYPFVDGRALVCKGCSILQNGEHSSWSGGKWGVINKKGNRIVPIIYDSIVVSSKGINGFTKSNGKWLQKNL